MTWAQLTMRVLFAMSLVVCASGCGDENDAPPPAARKPVSRGEGARGASEPMPRDADGAMREDASAVDGGLGDASLGDAGVDADASSLPMMLRDGGPNAGTGGIGGAGTGGVGGLGGLGGEGGIGAIGGTFER